MGYGLRSLLNDIGKTIGSLDEAERIWKSLITCMTATLSTGKGVSIKHLFFLTSVRTSTRSPHPGLKKHVFYLPQSICRSYGLDFRKVGNGLLSPCIEVNNSKISVLSGVSKDTVSTALKFIGAKLGEVMGSGVDVKIPFGELGALIAEGRFVSFKFQSFEAKGMIRSSDIKGVRGSEIESWVDTFMSRKKKEEREKEDVEREQLEALNKEDLAMQVMALRPMTTNSIHTSRSNQKQAEREQEQELPPILPQSLSPPMSAELPAPSRPKNWQEFMTAPESYANKKSKLSELMAQSSYPRFLIPDSKTYVSVDNPAVLRNMELAYERLEGRMGDNERAKVKQGVDIKVRQDKSYKEYLSKKERERKLRVEITKSLDEQSAFDRERRAREVKEMKGERGGGVGRGRGLGAYPMALPMNLVLEASVKKDLKDSLDLQVKNKQESDYDKRRFEMTRDRSIIDRLNLDLRRDREEKIRKGLSLNKSMSEHWQKQIDIGERMREIER